MNPSACEFSTNPKQVQKLIQGGSIDELFINPDQPAENNFLGKDAYYSPELMDAIENAIVEEIATKVGRGLPAGIIAVIVIAVVAVVAAVVVTVVCCIRRNRRKRQAQVAASTTRPTEADLSPQVVSKTGERSLD